MKSRLIAWLGVLALGIAPALAHHSAIAEYDLEKPVKPWAYFCQISDSTTSYGSYSGATPNEKITWDKLTEETPMFVIESDTTIVAPLILSALLECKQSPAEAKTLIASL